MSMPDETESRDNSIRTGCANVFRAIEGRLSAIETKLKEIRENQRTWGHRLWGLGKAVVLAVFVWILSGKINGKG